jgi:hypothetical protein
MHLRKAMCRSAAYGTDYSAAAHSAHEFFPHTWAEAVTCYGWTEAEAEAAAVVEQVRAAPDGATLEAHPGILAGISQLLTPDFPGEDDASIGHQVTRLFGVTLTSAPLQPGEWRLLNDNGGMVACTVVGRLVPGPLMPGSGMLSSPADDGQVAEGTVSDD